MREEVLLVYLFVCLELLLTFPSRSERNWCQRPKGARTQEGNQQPKLEAAKTSNVATFSSRQLMELMDSQQFFFTLEVFPQGHREVFRRLSVERTRILVETIYSSEGNFGVKLAENRTKTHHRNECPVLRVMVAWWLACG